MYKSLWIALLPIAAFANSTGDDLFYFSEETDDSLCHIEYEEDKSTDLDLKASNLSGLSLFEIEESQEVLSTWQPTDLASDREFSDYIESRAAEINEEFEDVFTYNLPIRHSSGEYIPTLEKVPERKGKLCLSRPKVVQSDTPKKVEHAPLATHKEEKSNPKIEETKAQPKQQILYRGKKLTAE